jgi:hypothetical protein
MQHSSRYRWFVGAAYSTTIKLFRYFGFCGAREESPRTRRKILEAKDRTHQQFNSHTDSESVIDYHKALLLLTENPSCYFDDDELCGWNKDDGWIRSTSKLTEISRHFTLQGEPY